MSNALLKEYVKALITEDDFSGLGYGDDGGPYGMDFTGGDHSKLAKVFIQPFTDVVKTAAGKGKEISTKAQTAMRTAIETVATTLIPALSSDYEEIFARDSERMEALQAQYKDVYDRTWTAFKDNDILAAAFAYAPAQMISLATLRKAPGPVLDTLNVLAGGKLDSWVTKAKKALKGRDEKKALDNDTGPDFAEGLIREDKEDGVLSNIAKTLGSTQISQLVNNNPDVKDMRANAQAIIRGSLEQVFDKANAIMKAQTIEQIEQIIGKQVPEFNNVPEEQRATVAKSMMQGLKASAKKMYVSGLKEKIDAAIEAGVPNEHPYVKDHLAALKKLQSL